MPITSTKPTGYSRFQEFTSSGTWTCPSGVSVAEIILVGAGGGGGGGGASGSNAANPTVSRPGGAGGGGGGGGEVIRRFVSVTPGTSYPITIGSGGAGATVGSTTQNVLYNAFFDPTIRSAGTTGWTLTAGTISASSVVNNVATGTAGTLNIAPNVSNLVTAVYDSGSANTVPFNTIANQPYTFSWQIYNNNAAQYLANMTLQVAWYNGTTLLRTDTGTAVSTTESTGPVYTTQALYSSLGHFGTNGLSGVPSTATRFVLTINYNAQRAATLYINNLYFGSTYFYSINGQVVSGSNTPWGFHDATSASDSFTWGGTANASWTLTANYIGGMPIGKYFGRRGSSGTSGGNSSFGSIVTALGGGGGGGGGPGQALISDYSINNAGYGFYYQGNTMCGQSQPALAGGNGGGDGGKTSIGASASNTLNPTAGAGGGASGGWTYFQVVSNDTYLAVVPRGALNRYASAGYRGYGGSQVYSLGGYGGTGYVISSPFTSTQTSAYSPILGAEGIGGLAYGGNGGSNGGYTTGNSDTTSRIGLGENYASQYPQAAGGAGGASGAAGVSAGVATAGSAGANATIYGSGGGGGGGAGAPNATTVAGTTFAAGQSGGAGGNGAGGYCLVMWTE